MKIIYIKDNRKQYLSLLLLADEQATMIDRYLDRGDMFALDDNGIKAVCVVTDEGDGICELKNIAVHPDYHRQGYGRRLIEFLQKHYAATHRQMIVGTGDGTSTVGFYERCGFRRSHTVKNFFTDNYDHTMIENGVELKDMVYLKADLK